MTTVQCGVSFCFDLSGAEPQTGEMVRARIQFTAARSGVAIRAQFSRPSLATDCSSYIIASPNLQLSCLAPKVSLSTFPSLRPHPSNPHNSRDTWIETQGSLSEFPLPFFFFYQIALFFGGAHPFFRLRRNLPIFPNDIVT
jgi:hypothetical protein